MTATPSTQLSAETLTGIVRGSVDWRVLERFGVQADIDRLPATFHQPGGFPIVLVTVDDLRAGFAAHLGDAVAMRQWAQIMLMCDSFDFAPVEEDPVGDLVLNALWDLAYGDRPGADAMAALFPPDQGRATDDGSAAV